MATGKHARIKIVIFLASLAVFAYATTPVISSSVDIDCIADVKLCPEGSYVSRTGSQCEFAPCPGKNNKNAFTIPESVLPDEPETSAFPNE